MGTYDRLFVDIDFTKDLLKEILIRRDRFEFIVLVEFENCPDFYRQCNVLRHDFSKWRLLRREDKPIDQRRPQSPLNNVSKTNKQDRKGIRV